MEGSLLEICYPIYSRDNRLLGEFKASVIMQLKRSEADTY